jgi:hypothetical protein
MPQVPGLGLEGVEVDRDQGVCRIHLAEAQERHPRGMLGIQREVRGRSPSIQVGPGGRSLPSTEAQLAPGDHARMVSRTADPARPSTRVRASNRPSAESSVILGMSAVSFMVSSWQHTRDGRRSSAGYKGPSGPPGAGSIGAPGSG